MDRRVSAVALQLEPEAAPGERRAAKIQVESLITVQSGPAGVGDTLAECDVSPRTGMSAGVRGEMSGAVIRMRASHLDVAGVSRVVEADAWVGAFMHELGHALGFSGHARTGATVLVREENRLRTIGREAIEGRAQTDPTLEALYTLPPGRQVGRRSLRPESQVWLAKIQRAVEERVARGEMLSGIHAAVGEEAARLVWRFASGDALVARFPRWRREVQSGESLTLLPGLRTWRALRARDRSRRSLSVLEIGLDRSRLRDQSVAFFRLPE